MFEAAPRLKSHINRSEILMQDYIETVSGARINLFRPDSNEIHLDDVATALSNLCRFTGHVKRWYSVAEHCLLVAALLPEHLKLTGLFHDAGEMVTNDIASPVKKYAPRINKIEGLFLQAAASKFGFQYPFPLEIKCADHLALYIEAHALKHSGGMDWEQFNDIDPDKVPAIQLSCYPPHVAKHVFLDMYYQITGHEQYSEGGGC